MATTSLDDYLSSNDSKAIYKKKEYSKNEWQHQAAIYAEELKIKLNSNWFKFFRENYDEPSFRYAKECMLYKGIKSDRYFYAIIHRRKHASS